MQAHELAIELELCERALEQLKERVNVLELALELVRAENEKLKSLLADALSEAIA